MIQALMDRVFVRLPPVQEKTDGGVIICDEICQNRTTGEVISVGEDVKSVKTGDRILFHVFDELPTIEKDVVAVRECSILGVFENG